MGSFESPKLPQINFSDLSLASSGTEEWTAVRSQVMRSLSELGCFETVYDKVITPELREAIFGKFLKEVFALPVEAKIRIGDGNTPTSHYFHDLPGMDGYEGIGIPDGHVDNFTSLLWGQQGYPGFRDTVSTFLIHLKELDEMVRKMIFEGFGVEKHFDAHMESLQHYTRLIHYGPPKNPNEPSVVLGIHTDMTFASIVCQHEREGLEVLTKDGSWITPSRNSLVFLVGDQLSAWSNGRLGAAHHRVRRADSGVRYSTNYSSTTKKGFLVQAPEELVDEEHPRLFKPFYSDEYYSFRFSEEGARLKNPLNAYCGITTATEEEKAVEASATEEEKAVEA